MEQIKNGEEKEMSKINLLREIRRTFPHMMSYQYLELIKELRKKQPVDHVPFQLCPKCNGNGNVEMHGYSARVTCDVCCGMKIIPMHPIIQKGEK